jgi:hypothetical protein
VGFASAGVFSSWLHWERSAFVLAHATLILLFFGLYLVRAGVDPITELCRRWPAGLAVGLVAGAALAYGVRRQVTSPAPSGSSLVGALLWFGIVYGLVDALLLSVVPIRSVQGSRSRTGPPSASARLVGAGFSLLASLAVTAAYHLGFAEFRGPGLIQPLIGNGLVSLAYILAGNPLAAIIAHVVMHLAAVLHGMATTTQLPPHY